MNIFLARSHNLELVVEKKTYKKTQGWEQKTRLPVWPKSSSLLIQRVICLHLEASTSLVANGKRKKMYLRQISDNLVELSFEEP